MYQHSDKHKQYQFTLRQHVSAVSRPLVIYQLLENEMGSHRVLILLYLFIRSVLA